MLSDKAHALLAHLLDGYGVFPQVLLEADEDDGYPGALFGSFFDPLRFCPRFVSPHRSTSSPCLVPHLPHPLHEHPSPDPIVTTWLVALCVAPWWEKELPRRTGDCAVTRGPKEPEGFGIPRKHPGTEACVYGRSWLGGRHLGGWEKTLLNPRSHRYQGTHLVLHIVQ